MLLNLIRFKEIDTLFVLWINRGLDIDEAPTALFSNRFFPPRDRFSLRKMLIPLGVAAAGVLPFGTVND
jgi:hypothetical protein